METTKDAANQAFSFETLAALYREEAGTLLSEESIKDTLDHEKKIWRFAQKINLPQTKYTGNNMQRYCKDLVRKKQPFYPLYFLLNYIFALSLLLLLCGAVITAVRLVLPNRPDSLPDFPVFYLLLFLIGTTFYRENSKKHYRISLSFFSSVYNLPDIPEDILSCISIQHRHDRLAFFCVLLPSCLLLIGIDFLSGLSNHASINLLTAVYFFAGSEILCGLHNILYSSRLLAQKPSHNDLTPPEK